MLLTEKNLTYKAMDAIIDLFYRFVEPYQAEVAIDIASKRMIKMDNSWDKRALLEEIVEFFPQQEKTWKLIIQCARFAHFRRQIRNLIFGGQKRGDFGQN